MREELGNRKVIPKVFQQFAFAFETWRERFLSLTRILINQTHDGTATVRPLQRVLGNSTGKLLFAKPVNGE